MELSELLRLALENAAGHLANLAYVQELVGNLLHKCDSFETFRAALVEAAWHADTTVQTDARILLNECEYILRRARHGPI